MAPLTLLTLPQELRDKIFKFVFMGKRWKVDRRDLLDRELDEWSDPPSCSLLLVNKSIHAQAKPALWKHITHLAIYQPADIAFIFELAEQAPRITHVEINVSRALRRDAHRITALFAYLNELETVDIVLEEDNPFVSLEFPTGIDIILQNPRQYVKDRLESMLRRASGTGWVSSLLEEARWTNELGPRSQPPRLRLHWLHERHWLQGPPTSRSTGWGMFDTRIVYDVFGRVLRVKRDRDVLTGAERNSRSAVPDDLVVRLDPTGSADEMP